MAVVGGLPPKEMDGRADQARDDDDGADTTEAAEDDMASMDSEVEP